MRALVLGLVSFGVVAASGCATQHKAIRHQPGDALSRPSMEVLPSLDVAQAELTPEMRMASLLSSESLLLAAPTGPRDDSTAAISDWSDSELKEWLREKHVRAEAARKELDRAAVQNHRQRVMAGAMVGLVYEDVARTLLALPVPRELALEPEIATMYQDLLKRQAAPYLLHAHQAYVACAGNAEQVEALRHWSHFCEGREERLPTSGLDQPGAGPTRVSVVRK